MLALGKRMSSSLMQFTYGAVAETIEEEDIKAAREMSGFTLSFIKPMKEKEFSLHRQSMGARHHFSYCFKASMCLLSIVFITIYDVWGAAGLLEDSEEMKGYYTDRLKWHAGFAVVWIAMFMASTLLPSQRPQLWRNVCRVGGMLVFVFKAGANMSSYASRYDQFERAQLVDVDGPWTKRAHDLGANYLMDSYFMNSITGSLFILVLVQAVLKFDWLGNLLSTSVMVVLTILLAVVLERQVDGGEASTSRTALFSLFALVAGGLFAIYSYNEERRKRIEWYKTQLHIDELNRARRQSGAQRAIQNVQSEMDVVINTLINLNKKKDDPQLKRVIAMLRGGNNLWEASVADMNLMPQWLQEQNRAYMIKKENQVGRSRYLQVCTNVCLYMCCGTVFVAPSSRRRSWRSTKRVPRSRTRYAARRSGRRDRGFG